MTADWYILHTKPNKEGFFWNQLLAHQIEVYYPCVQASVISRFTHKIKPYFTGYLFVFIDLQVTPLQVLGQMPGSLGLVALDSQPLPVPENLIAAIRNQVDQLNLSKDETRPSSQPLAASDWEEGRPGCSETIFNAGISGRARARALLSFITRQSLPEPLREMH